MNVKREVGRCSRGHVLVIGSIQGQLGMET